MEMNINPEIRIKPDQAKYPIAFSGRAFYAVKAGVGVVTTSNSSTEASQLRKWKNIVALAATIEYTVGLRADGTLLVSGYKLRDFKNSESGNLVQCVNTWKEIRDIACGKNYLVGLKRDGSVVASRSIDKDSIAASNVEGWRNIVAISCGYSHTVGLRSDGTVVATGDNYDGRCNVSQWRNIVAISAGSNHTLGLKADGTVVSTVHTYDPKYNFGQTDVSSWKNIVGIAAGHAFSIGLRSDGRLVATRYIVTSDTFGGQHSELRYINKANQECNIAEIRGFTDSGVICLRKDGTVAHIGGSDWYLLGLYKHDGELLTKKIPNIRLFDSYDEAINPNENPNRNKRDVAADDSLLKEDPKYDVPQINLKRNGTVTEYYESVVTAIETYQRTIATLESKKRQLIQSRKKLGLFSGSKKKDIDTRLYSLDQSIANANQSVLRLQQEYRNRPLSLRLNEARVGGYVEFGQIKQHSNYIKEIRWQVLAKTEDKALLISEFCLSAQCFAYHMEPWSSCSLREWLNGKFYTQAFNEKERQSILPMKLPDVGTVDRIFCLSAAELQQFIPNQRDRYARFTPTADEEFRFQTREFKEFHEYGVEESWWIRTPYQNPGWAGCVKQTITSADKSAISGVRPAMWVSLK